MQATDTSDRNQRPSPEALLSAAKSAGQGRLKIFLGAAPGVGKTYKMLLAAQTVRKEGADIVVGVVETHKRAETEALLEGLEIIPRRRIDYKDHVLEEMDIDAILARKPKLVLVDELAHTNVAGSRHPKRYLDVEELLAAGIDVYTTINIQHVESLNDVVAQITHVRVRETVPDGILDRADDIEVVDLSPDDLIERLREGKVYVPAEAERALRNYFQPGNLTALARARLAPHGAARRRADAHLYARACDQRPVGRGRARAGLRQRGCRRAGPRALCAPPGRSLARALDRDLCRDRALSAARRSGARPRSPIRCASPSGWAGRR